VSEVVRVNKDVKEKLVKISAELQLSEGRKVSLNDTIGYLITLYEEKKRTRRNEQSLLSLLGSARGVREVLERSRVEDEGGS
jgi:hypothetical protein